MVVVDGLTGGLGFENLVLTVGSFDGVHLGHRKLLERLREVANEVGGMAGVLTFDPHPRRFLSPWDDTIRLITSTEEKIGLLGDAGVDVVVVVRFDEGFSRLSSEDFIRGVLIDKLNVRHIVTGYDHHFGSGRSGSSDDLSACGLRVVRISEEDIDDIAVSSTRIRRALIGGDVRMANVLLGHCYAVWGTVVSGNRLGRTMGFPTANLEIEDVYRLIERRGVYAVRVMVGGVVYGGMCNIGVRPTFNLSDVVYEVNIFDFDRDIYGERIRVEFVDKIRDEIRFGSKDELSEQLVRDRGLVMCRLGMGV